MIYDFEMFVKKKIKNNLNVINLPNSKWRYFCEFNFIYIYIYMGDVDVVINRIRIHTCGYWFLLTVTACADSC
jgi:hypothetical protein